MCLIFFKGSISDKQIVQRSGFLETVKQKVQCGELKGDAIMADKGFDIGEIEAEYSSLLEGQSRI